MIDFLIDASIAIGFIIGFILVAVLFAALAEYIKGYREYRKVIKRGFRIGGHFSYEGEPPNPNSIGCWKERYITSFDLLNRYVYYTETRYYKSFDGTIISHRYEREYTSLRLLLEFYEPIKSKPRGILSINVDKEIRL